MSKRRKRSKKHRKRTRKDKNRKRRNKGEIDKAEVDKYDSNKKKRSLKERKYRLKDDYYAHRRRQDIIFVVIMIIFAAIGIIGYYYYETTWGGGDDGSGVRDSGLNGENNGNPGNGDGNNQNSGIEWYEFDTGLERARSNNKPVMIDFYYDGCYWCDELDKNTYSDSKVTEKSKSFVCVKVDAYEQTKYDGEELTADYNVNGYPTIVFLDTNQKEIHRVNGYVEAGPFLEDMDFALNNA